MSLCCVYHKSKPFRVVEDELADELVATGEWFKHPSCTIKEEINHEEPIRRRTRKGRGNGNDSPQEARSGT